jgi:hypothetical protein
MKKLLCWLFHTRKITHQNGPIKCDLIEKNVIEKYGKLTRQRVEDIDYPVGDWRWTGSHKIYQYQYWCNCGTKLTDGPTGGCAVNAVCGKCRINYGNLPGYWGE